MLGMSRLVRREPVRKLYQLKLVGDTMRLNVGLNPDAILGLSQIINKPSLVQRLGRRLKGRPVADAPN